jgi:hypothetical protein
MEPARGLEVRQRRMGAPDAAPEVDAHQLLIPAQVSALTCSNSAWAETPALLISTSSPPNCCAALDQRAALGLFAHIGGHHQHLRPQGPALLCHGLQIAGIARGQRQLQRLPGLCQLAGHFGAYAVRGSGDDDAGMLSPGHAARAAQELRSRPRPGLPV